MPTTVPDPTTTSPPYEPDALARALAMLATLPGCERWRSTDLPREVRRWLDDADEQALMTLAAESIVRLLRHAEARPASA